MTTVVTKDSTIWCLGHLPIHIDGKVEGLKKAGFANAKPMYCQSSTSDEMKAQLAGSPSSLLYVGGAAGAYYA